MARTFSTPGVYRREIDLSDILVPAGISNGGVVIRSYKGPINRPVPISNDKEFIETFGSPIFLSGSGSTGNDPQIPEYGYGHYAALEFLKESNTLNVVRNYSSTDQYANAYFTDTGTASTSATINLTATPSLLDQPDRIAAIDGYTGSIGKLLVGATYPGLDGNNIAVNIESFSTSADWLYSYDPYPSSASNITSGFNVTQWAAVMPIAAKVFKINVYVKDSKYSSWNSYYTNQTDKDNEQLRITPVETFYGTLQPTLDDKNSLYITDVVNGNSKYIYVKPGTGNFTNITTYSALPVRNDTSGQSFVDAGLLVTLGNGTVDQDNGLNDGTDGWSLFENREDVNVNILICPNFNTVAKMEAARISAKRMDSITVVQAGSLSDITYNQVLIAEQYGYQSPSYVAVYAGYSKVYDQYNDKFVYLPNAIYGAMLMARVDNIADPWSAPAGIDRGTLSVVDQKKVYTFTDIGKLYDRNINTTRLIRGTGFVMWGQKTAQMKKSALDRINVRRNLLFIENNIETSLLPFCFENNNVKTRLRIFSIVDGFLSTVQAGGGLTGYNVVCDETNNTSEVIDSNQLNVDIYVQPARTAEFIQLTTVITRSGINLSEIRI